MKIYNVAVMVVDLIAAESLEDSVQILESKLRAAGFDPLEFSGNGFESEGENEARSSL